jgi:hypothetical protein
VGFAISILKRRRDGILSISNFIKHVVNRRSGISLFISGRDLDGSVFSAWPLSRNLEHCLREALTRPKSPFVVEPHARRREQLMQERNLWISSFVDAVVNFQNWTRKEVASCGSLPPPLPASSLSHGFRNHPTFQGREKPGSQAIA